MNVMSKPPRRIDVSNPAPTIGAALLCVYEISKILARSRPLSRTLSDVTAVLQSYLDMRHGLITIFDAAGAPELIAGPGWSEDATERFFRDIPAPTIAEIVATAMPVFIRDVAVAPQFRNSAVFADYPLDLRISLLGVPIKAGDDVIGTLTVDRVWNRPVAFQLDEDLQYLSTIANLIGQTVTLHRLLPPQTALRDDAEPVRARTPAPASAAITPARTAGIVGESVAIARVFDKAAAVARTRLTVLLRGESGTGKELFARAIHDLSPRVGGPFIKLNCAALPESVLESELFGHEKGAFTGALGGRKGRFELADGGTLFLDEIGEISQAFQTKLLRVLQEGEFERVGSNKTLKVDVRIVAATNRDLEEAVAKGDFRADLYYRIAVVPIVLPALRERPGDIPMLAREFIRQFNVENDTRLKLTSPAIGVLKACGFPGNVRELQNCIRRTAALARGPEITSRDFACFTGGCLASTLWRGRGADGAAQISRASAPAPVTMPAAGAGCPPEASTGIGGAASAEPLRTGSVLVAGADCGGLRTAGDSAPVLLACPTPGGCRGPGVLPPERERLIAAMEITGWVQAKAARLLDLTPRQIGYALKKHGIELRKF